MENKWVADTEKEAHVKGIQEGNEDFPTMNVELETKLQVRKKAGLDNIRKSQQTRADFTESGFSDDWQGSSGIDVIMMIAEHEKRLWTGRTLECFSSWWNSEYTVYLACYAHVDWPIR